MIDNDKDQTSRLALQAIFREGFESNVPQCQHEGCNAPSIQCTIPAGIDLDTDKPYPETYEYFCPTHAPKNGFCAGCGTFIWGWRDFSDYCEHCEDQINEDDLPDSDDLDANDDFGFMNNNNPYDQD